MSRHSHEDEQHGGTVLVADDEQIVRRSCALLLESIGFAVLTARDGLEAVEHFVKKQDQIVLTLLDVNMPRLDGPSALAKIRQLAPAAPVLMMSGASHGLAGVADQPDTHFLRKPFDASALSSAVNSLLAVRPAG